MQALGLIETIGLVASIESADAMLKAADVTLLEKTYVGGGLVSVAVTGEVAAVKAAVDAGAAAVKHLNSTSLVSQHVIPRPHEELDELFGAAVKPAKPEIQIIEPEIRIIELETIIIEEPTALEDPKELTKEDVDAIVAEYGPAKAIEILSGIKVVKLRNLARDYKDLGIAGRLVSKADKKMLLVEFGKYYEKH